MHETTTTFTNTWVGYAALTVLLVGYIFVIAEEKIHLRKSKPVLFAAGIIWLLIGIAMYGTEQAEAAAEHLRHNFWEWAEILVFLMVAMSYVNVLEERRVFDTLRSRLIRGGWTYRQLFWLTGTIAFFLSPVADNMTTALIMGAVAIAVGGRNSAFISASCVNIVVAANAGGAFSPFGDITTLMVWQAGILPFFDFFHLLPSALVTWLLPAIIMSLTIPNRRAVSNRVESVVTMKVGARRVMMLFALTIACAVAGHNFFHFPPVVGMLFGLSFLKLFGYYLKMSSTDDNPFDVMPLVQRIEWDTLLFFGGIILAVGGIGYLGYLSLLSSTAYESWAGMSREMSVTVANAGVGVLSALIDNIPIMFAVLSMNPEMSEWQWLLVTLTAGVGGSMLSIGSAAGVALMGAARGHYTFASHLRFTPVIGLGYIAGIATHYGYAVLLVPHLF